MVEEYEMEESADAAIEELRMFIDTEKQLVEEEHELSAKLLSWDYIIGHLDERIPSNLKDLHSLNGKIAQKLLEMRELVESGSLEGLRILQGEERELEKTASDAQQRDWIALKIDIEANKSGEERVVRL